MMGLKRMQTKWFYSFSLDERVPQDHLLRLVDQAIDFSFVRDLVRDTYSHAGAPSVDPVVVFKMALLGYLYGITSERRLAEEIRLNLAYMWFLGYDLDELPPDHSILSKARARYGLQAYRQFFSEAVKRCREVGLIDGDRVYLDATLVRVNASLDSLVSRPLYRQLVNADEYIERLRTENPSERDSEPAQARRSPGAEAKPVKRAANERRVSRTDPEAAIINDKRKGSFLARKVHVAADGGPDRVITGVVVTPGNRPEGHQVELLLGQHRWLVGRKPDEVVADRGYSYTRVYEYLRRQRIRPTIPRKIPWRKTSAKREKMGFVYVPELDRYRCPRGKWLYNVRIPNENQLLYRTHHYACRDCDLKPDCPRSDRCSITRPADTGTRQWLDAPMARGRARRAIRSRPYWVETVFADLKDNHTLGRARLRGWAFEAQALLAATAHNIEQLVKGKGPRARALKVASLRSSTSARPVSPLGVCWLWVSRRSWSLEEGLATGPPAPAGHLKSSRDTFARQIGCPQSIPGVTRSARPRVPKGSWGLDRLAIVASPQFLTSFFVICV